MRMVCVVLWASAALCEVASSGCSGQTSAPGGISDGGTSDGNNPTGSCPLPYSGPSCAQQVSASCCACQEQQCGEACVVTDCKDFYACFCACLANDAACRNRCGSNVGMTCGSCLEHIATCTPRSCQTQCANEVPRDITTCFETGTCHGGLTEGFCTETYGTACQSQYYTVGTQRFYCSGCGGCNAAAQEAQGACQ